MKTYDAIVSAPTFSLGIQCENGSLREVYFLPKQKEQAPNNPTATEAVRQLSAWLDSPDFIFTLPLLPQGSPFRQRVWREIAAIPCGETRSYGDLAAALNSSPRAVGTACGDNPFPIIVPCHRVIAKGGGIGGFAHTQDDFHLGIKRWLLSYENAHEQT